MNLFPDSGWVNALKLPTKIIVGLFLFSALLLIFDSFKLVPLVDFGTLTRPIVIISVLLFGCLSFASLVALAFEIFTEHRKPKLLSERRKIRREEKAEHRAEYEATVLKRLDFLSKEEIHYVADCLRKNEQSFLSYVHSGPISNLMAKGFVTTPGGNHNRDYYPFYFYDFAWNALLKRKDEFIEKDDESKRIEAEK